MPEDLHVTVKAVFLKMGMSDADATTSADVLVSSDVRGVDTHGVSNMLRRYVDMFNEEFVNPTPDWKIIRESPTTANMDGDAGLGLVIGPKAMEIAIEKASEFGMGAVTIGNARHFGMMAYHAMLPMPHDMIGYAITGGGSNTIPTFGAEPRFGANPHAWAVPAGEEPPFVLDISSSSVAANKIGLVRRNGVSLLPGLLGAEDGTPIMEETDDIPEQTWLLPVGSTRELGSHKGYGLGVIAQVFSGILSSGQFGSYGAGRMAGFVAAYSIDAFQDVAKFKQDMDKFLRYLRETTPAPGHDRVYYAGLPEHEEKAAREADGIPLHNEVVDWFDSITAELDLETLIRAG